MLMKYAAIVTYIDGSKTDATIEAQSTDKAWNKILNLFNPETVSGIEELWTKYPELFQRAVAMEHNAAASLITVKGLGRKWSWEDYHTEVMQAKEFEEAQISFDQLFPEAKGGCLCGAPCGCYDG